MLEALLLGLLGAVADAVHPRRARILEVVATHPGITLTALRDVVGCSWGTIHHHTQVLERRGRLRSEAVGRSRRFFTAETAPPTRRGVALLRKGRVGELVRAIRERPGCVQRDLTEGLHLTRKVLRSYVDDLVAQGLVEERRHPRVRTYHPTQALQALLDELEPAEVPVVGASGLTSRSPRAPSARRPPP